MNYNFEWNPGKAVRNQQKHGISFERACTVFHDPNQLSIYDEEHSDEEERWITLGMDNSGNLLIVIHTFRVTSEKDLNIRVISARRATLGEIDQYHKSITR